MTNLTIEKAANGFIVRWERSDITGGLPGSLRKKVFLSLTEVLRFVGEHFSSGYWEKMALIERETGSRDLGADSGCCPS